MSVNTSVFCATIETNKNTSKFSKAPIPLDRTIIRRMPNPQITIEPIMDFDLFEFVELIKYIQPIQVNIGADSKNHGLPEPSAEKINALISEIEKFTKVHKKENLTNR